MSAEILDREMVFKRLQATLEELAKLNVEQIVALFVREDARGPRLNHCKCPTAVFLEKRIGETVSVGTSDIVLTRDISTKGYRSALTPPSVREFIRNYDSGRYPELWPREYWRRS